MERNRKVSLISLGCSKNLVDSEGIVSDLLTRGIDVVPEPNEADVVVVNTCGFLGAAREESVRTIREMIRLKNDGLAGVVVTGCMVGNYADQIGREAPGVDRLVDFADYRKLPDLVDDILPPEHADGLTFVRPGRRVEARLTPAHFAYLKISEGCNHTCSFCVIPKIRGRMRSVPFRELLDRARRLVATGARELVVIAQDSTLYGSDLYGRVRLVELLKELSEIDDLHWIRLLYAYPTEVTDDLVEALASKNNKVVPYLDVPIQHTSDRMLDLMKRRSSEAAVEDMMRRLRAAGDIAIRTTLIVGFPGETEADIEHTLEFVDRHRIDRLGAFTYSKEEGSVAARLSDAVPEEVQQERLDRVMTLQHGIAETANRAKVGEIVDVMIDDPETNGTAVGRTSSDAPDIDGTVVVRGAECPAGSVVRTRVTAASTYDLEAVVENT